MRIAIVGTGISGLACAWMLGQRHDVAVYEAEPRLGGHSHTVDLPWRGGSVPVDTGFIVYNERNYPNLARLFEHLAVPTLASDMSFGVSIDDGRVEYSGSSLRTLFAQKRNLLRPSHHRMLWDILRFNRDAKLFLADARACTNMFYDKEQEKKADRHSQVLKIPVSDFELSVRSRNCLQKMNIDTLGDLIMKTEQELLIKRLIVEGVVAVQQERNPSKLERKLLSFLTPSARPRNQRSFEQIRRKYRALQRERREVRAPARRAELPPRGASPRL